MKGTVSMDEYKKPGAGYAAVLEPAEDDEEVDSSALLRHGNVGLCANCELRETCIRLKPAGGIWFCEEYR